MHEYHAKPAKLYKIYLRYCNFFVKIYQKKTKKYRSMPMYSCTKARLTKQRCWLSSPESAWIDLSSLSMNEILFVITQGGDEVLPVRHPRDHVNHGRHHDPGHHQPGGLHGAQLLGNLGKYSIKEKR